MRIFVNEPRGFAGLPVDNECARVFPSDFCRIGEATGRADATILDCDVGLPGRAFARQMRERPVAAGVVSSRPPEQVGAGSHKRQLTLRHWYIGQFAQCPPLACRDRS